MKNYIKNNNFKKTMQFILLALIIIFILYYNEILGYINNDNVAEDFTDINGVKVNYEYNITNNKYPETIYELSIKKKFNKYPVMLCNLLPTRKESECLINGTPIIKYKFPVHIMKNIDGMHYAVFNDGRIYKKRNLTDKLWQGPLKYSLPEREVPLRMITLNPNGNKFIGVGYNNKCYIKKEDTNSIVATETEWKYIEGLDDVIWVGFIFDANSNENKWLIINTDGKIMLSNTENPLEGFIDASIIKEPVLKLYFDPDGYMLAIDSNMNLRTFEKKDWMVSGFSKKYPANPIPINDIIYDYDQKLFGVVFLPKMGQCEIMKQEESAFMSPFVPFELNSYLDSRLDKRLTDRHILKSKMGIFTKSGLLEEAALDNDVNIAYQRQQLMDKKRLREFCQKRGIQTDVNYRNYEMDKIILENENKIKKLDNVIKELIKFDPDNKKIQESVVGINYLKEDI
jgi:hypothetical protein